MSSIACAKKSMSVARQRVDDWAGLSSVLVAAVAMVAWLGASMAAANDWKTAEIVRTYAISGRTGAELYASIGRNGPKAAGGQRVIAHTSFRLTWTRDYQPRDGSCALVSALPRLTVTYALPRPTTTLAPAVRASWERFIAGVRDHERRHGAMIEDLVRQIETASVGLTVADDPGCTKIRTELTRRLATLSAAHQQRNRDFDRVELSNGGNVQQLILALVNGP